MGGALVAKIQSMLAKPNVLCGHFDQSKQLAKKADDVERPILRGRRQRGVVAVRPFPIPSGLHAMKSSISGRPSYDAA